MDKIYIVMDYIEHDLKALMETMKESFSIGQLLGCHLIFHCVECINEWCFEESGTNLPDLSWNEAVKRLVALCCVSK